MDRSIFRPGTYVLFSKNSEKIHNFIKHHIITDDTPVNKLCDNDKPEKTYHIIYQHRDIDIGVDKTDKTKERWKRLLPLDDLKYNELSKMWDDMKCVNVEYQSFHILLSSIQMKLRDDVKTLWISKEMQSGKDVSKYLDIDENEDSEDEDYQSPSSKFPTTVQTDRPVVVVFFNDIDHFIKSINGKNSLDMYARNSKGLLSTIILVINHLDFYDHIPEVTKASIHGFILLDMITKSFYDKTVRDTITNSYTDMQRTLSEGDVVVYES